MMNALDLYTDHPRLSIGSNAPQENDEIGHEDSKAGANEAGSETEGRNEYKRHSIMHEIC